MLPIPEVYIPPTLNLDVNGKPLTYRSAKNGPDRLLWERAEADELIRLLDSETIVPIRYSDTLENRLRNIVYYNPWSSRSETITAPPNFESEAQPADRDRLTVPYDVSLRLLRSKPSKC